MNEHPFESSGNSADPFEQLLRACKPAGGNQLEQMLYQAGWQAAMAQINIDSQIEKKADRLSVPNSTVSVGNRKTNRSWKWFGSGLATGVAVSLLAVFMTLAAVNWDRSSTALVENEKPLENRGEIETNKTTEEGVAQLHSDNQNIDREWRSRSRHGISNFGWGHWLGSSTEQSLELVTHRNHSESTDIDWDALPPSYQKHRKLWQDGDRRKSNDQPQTFETRQPLTVAKIRELL